MISKTRGIVLRTVDYSDTSIITKIYTEEFGVQSYLIKGARRKNASVKANLFQPLALLELVCYKKENKQLQTLKEAKPEIYFASIPTDPAKTAVIFFLNEILLKCLQEEENNPELFSFLHESVQALESTENNVANFHLIFLLRFSRFLGFFPQGKFSQENAVFDLRAGTFTHKEPMHPDFLTAESSRLISKLLISDYYLMENLKLSAQERKNMLDILLHYYHLHLLNMGSVTSHKILEQVLS